MESARLKPPPGACDCHMHVYEDRYPLAPTATFKPPHAPVDAYRKVQQDLGLERTIVVQPTGYGFDNSCTLDALAALGDTARGVAVIAPDLPDDEVEKLHARGMRGVRFMMLGGVLPWEALEPMASRLQAFDWHVNLQLDGRELPDHAALLQRVPGKLVIDHTGKFLEPVTPDDPAFKALCRLLDGGKCWVKLSAPYETSRDGAPHYGDVGLLARTLAAAYPERCLWASNWPHPNRDPLPSDAGLLDLLLDWAPDERARHRILVENPEEVYGFPRS
ncbi:amidohydrolase family protein [Noviherbaspirillum malthae]|jgi:D-galactarolactone isomerase|uniref:amidohydrolase family protein n=1 Tax=Noviherbaspirillum malthae TaxID=1260987 RepID=UPI00188E15D0|nr:amidohydrolase family protein [Noviherbaspirillum malthae]